MGSMTDVFEKKLLDYLFRDASLGLDATNMWIALFTTTPTDSTTGTEVTGGSYARVAVVRTGAGWDAASGASPGTTQNTGAITFATATADWGTVTGFGICKSLAGALSTDLIYWAALNANKTVSNGDTASFAAAALAVTQD
jgi:hypothetical protein